jgi:hypothetical protein
MDFTLPSYHDLLSALLSKGFFFQTFSEFLTNPKEKVIILRHDVDARKLNSLRFAKIQSEYGIKGSYYFRVVPQSWDEHIIREIHALGHEIGYHYETMDTASKNFKLQHSLINIQNSNSLPDSLIDSAYIEFCTNLERFRKIVPVKTICMHGSPRSKYDNRDIWKKYDYRKLGIIGEPYRDIDFSKVAYLTDTGRRWNGDKVSIRDRVKSPFNFNFRTTRDIIRSVDELPDQVMFTFHPQRWTDNMLRWSQELTAQNLKNQLKRWMV